MKKGDIHLIIDTPSCHEVRKEGGRIRSDEVAMILSSATKFGAEASLQAICSLEILELTVKTIHECHVMAS